MIYLISCQNVILLMRYLNRVFISYRDIHVYYVYLSHLDKSMPVSCVFDKLFTSSFFRPSLKRTTTVLFHTWYFVKYFVIFYVNGVL